MNSGCDDLAPIEANFGKPALEIVDIVMPEFEPIRAVGLGSLAGFMDRVV
jgi:hypothetical protein